MKCLSVCQPYAHLIVSGAKTVELRGWSTRVRGEFLVHAARSVRRADCRRLGIGAGGLPTGAVVGRAELLDVVEYASGRAVEADRARHLAPRGYHAARGRTASGRSRTARYGFVLGSARALRIPIPMPGRLGFFDVDARRLLRSGGGAGAAAAAAASPTDDAIRSEIIDEEHRYRLVGWH